MIPFTWRIGAGQRTRLLQEFAQTELDSAWQSLHALKRVDDPRIRALLFSHALEERHHAELFTEAAQEHCDFPVAIPLTRRRAIADVEPSPARFFAALSVGESEIRNDFAVYRRAIPDAKVKDLFACIAADEEGHARGSVESLAELSARDGFSLRRIWWAHVWRLFVRRHQSLGMKAGSGILEALVSVLYFVFGGVGYAQARTRIAMSYAEQLAIVKTQNEAADARIREP